MTIAEFRKRAFIMLDETDFESSLPAGECDNATVVEFLNRRREEIVAVARRALDENAGVLLPEVLLRCLFGEITDEEFSIVTTQKITI